MCFADAVLMAEAERFQRGFPGGTGGPCLSKASRGLTQGWGAPPPLRRSAEKASRRACARLGPSLMVTSDIATLRCIVSAQHAQH